MVSGGEVVVLVFPPFLDLFLFSSFVNLKMRDVHERR